MRRLRLALTLLALAAAPAVAFAATGSGRVLFPGCLKAQYKPRKVFLGCDGSNYLKALTWSHWTRKSATGKGIHEIDDCQPDCATGQFHAYPVTVTVSRPRSCRKLRNEVFGHIVLTYTSTHPPGGRIQRAPLFCPI